MMRRNVWIRRLVPLLAAALLAIPAAAQVSTGTIEVVTKDAGGAALPGITVQLRNVETGLQRVDITAGDGFATFAGLPPGEYSVSAALEGYAPISDQRMVLRVGQTGRFEFTMQAQVSETITVTAEVPQVDVLKIDSSTNVVPEQIQQLPTQNRDFQNLAFITPGVSRERGGYRFINNSPVIGAAGNASQATIMVDGVDFTDQALGLSRARFSQDAIREFRVINNRFDAEIGGSAGGALSVITKSGTNQVHGSAFGFYRDDSLRSKGALEEGSGNFRRYQVGFTLGGPIVQDKTHYFLSTEYIDEHNIAIFSPTGIYAPLARDINHPFKQFLGSGSLTFQPNISNAIALRGVYENYREKNFRVGGVADESSGMELNRDNYNLVASHTWVPTDDTLNELRFQYGHKEFAEPNNSNALSEYYASGSALITGANIVGDQTMKGDYIELSDTYHIFTNSSRSSHDVKLGGSVSYISEDWYYPVFPQGLLFYLYDFGVPWRFDYAVGPPDLKVDTTLIGVFIQDDWRPAANFTLSYGLRYDYDTDGNNPNFKHPLVGQRSRDENNFQPRVGFSWDVNNDGTSVLRGGAGLFNGRYLLVPSFIELQQNGISGRTPYTRYDGPILCLLNGIPAAYCPFPALDPTDLYNSGVVVAPNIALLQDTLRAPDALQASLGFTRRLGSTNLYLDLEGVYIRGDNEIIIRDVNWGGNDNPVRPNPAYTQINMYTNDGRSEYKAATLSLNGTVGNGNIITASVTWGDKKNIADDFSPNLLNYPSDPADIEAEYGRSRSDEEWRVVLSGVFNVPWNITIAPIYTYGSGQPWNRRLGYDYNGDGRFGDRAPGVPRNSEDGPEFKQLDLRITKTITFGDGRAFDIIVEGFNVFNTVNYDVESINTGEYTSGPTLANPALPYVNNPAYGTYTATLPPREIQVGARYRF